MKIRVGIIGCGSIAEFRHAPEYALRPDVEITTFYSPTRSRAERLAERYGGRVAERFEDILDDPSIDAISDCSTNDMHHIMSAQALLKGKHVLCEKPLAASVEQAEQILHAAEVSGKVLMVGHNQRMLQAHKKAKELVSSGELGKVLMFKTNFAHKGPEYWSAANSNSTWFFKKNRSEFGVAGDLGAHKFDLIRYLLDDEICEISAMEGTLDKKDENGRPIEVCDNMICLLRTKKGALGTASFSWTCYGEEDNSTVIYGEKGVLRIYADKEYDLELFKLGGETVLYRFGGIQTNDRQTNSGVIDAFIESIAAKKTPPATGEDGLTVLRIINAAALSAQENRTVTLM